MPSTMKSYLEECYTTNIEGKRLSSAVVDGIFCDDRTIISGYDVSKETEISRGIGTIFDLFVIKIN